MNKQKPTTHILIAAIICSVYVALGAFGAHGLESKLSIDQLDTYNTGLRYLIIHALGLLAINLTFIVKDTFSILTNTFIYTGMVFFSLSLVLHATKDYYTLMHSVCGGQPGKLLRGYTSEERPGLPGQQHCPPVSWHQVLSCNTC